MIVGYYYIEDENFNLLPNEFVKINNISEYKNDKPLILIGYLNNRDKFNIDIDESKINENLFWTFSINEYRDRFNNDLYFFKEYCYKLLFETMKYEFFNLFEKKYSDIKKLINFVSKNKIYLTNEMLYLVYKNKVIGIDLNQIDMFFCSKIKLLKKIKTRCAYQFLDEKTVIHYKSFLEFNNSKYVIPYLISLSE
jgi:hypothetical protein